jgi:uncharacterized membrane protein YhaH (DUF805 family)
MRELNPVQWAVLPLKRYADFAGRAPRAEYWWYTLAVGVAALLLGVVDVTVLGGTVYGNYGALGLTFVVACAVPSMAVLVRRLHDNNHSGWWALIRLPSYGFVVAGGSTANVRAMLFGLPVPFAIALGIIWVVVAFVEFLFVITEGEGMENQYGPDPYGAEELEEVFA